MWSYQYQTPLDLLEWLRGLYATNIICAGHIRMDTGITQFPGAGTALLEFWHNLAITYTGAAAASATAAEGYEISARDVLARHTNPRPHEHLANAGRRNL